MNNINQNISVNNTFTYFNTNLNNKIAKSHYSENNITKENEHISIDMIKERIIYGRKL